jgi:hypothetical protein
MAEFGGRGSVSLVRDWNVLTQYYEDESSAEVSDAVQVGEMLIRTCLRRPVARVESTSLCPDEHLATRPEIFHRLSRRGVSPITPVADAPPGKVEEIPYDETEPQD